MTPTEDPGFEVPDYVAATVRRAPPPSCHIVEGSTPVVAFGDPGRAEVATLGINPSASEFVANGTLLTGDARRLATLSSLGATTNTALTDLQVQTLVAECATYFHRRPYTRWFGILDGVLRAELNVSYSEHTACHLDLVPWATDPAWSELPIRPQQRSLADGVPHPLSQLRRENICLVVVNGKAVWDQLAATGVATFEDVDELPYSNVGGTTTKLRIGSSGSARFLGWTRNRQAPPGSSTGSVLVHEQQGRGLQQHLDPLHECRRVPAVDDAMVEARGQVEHLARLERAVAPEGPSFDLVDADDRDLGRVENRRGHETADGAERCDRERRTGQLLP